MARPAPQVPIAGRHWQAAPGRRGARTGQPRAGRGAETRSRRRAPCGRRGAAPAELVLGSARPRPRVALPGFSTLRSRQGKGVSDVFINEPLPLPGVSSSRAPPLSWLPGLERPRPLLRLTSPERSSLAWAFLKATPPALALKEPRLS